MYAVPHCQLTPWRDDAPQRTFFTRDLEPGASRFSREVLDIPPITVVVFRMRCHGETHGVAGATNSHFDGEAGQIGGVDSNSVRDAWLQFLTKKGRLRTQSDNKKQGCQRAS